jgi:adenosine deaminase
MFAERIGHGYRIMNDKSAYARCLKEKVHFEACPTSSILTGSVSIRDAMLRQHPIMVMQTSAVV